MVGLLSKGGFRGGLLKGLRKWGFWSAISYLLWISNRLYLGNEVTSLVGFLEWMVSK